MEGSSILFSKSYQKKYNYYVVEFWDGLELIPKNWFVDDKAYCPKSLPRFYNFVEKMEKPHLDWKTYKIGTVYGGAGMYLTFNLCKLESIF